MAAPSLMEGDQVWGDTRSASRGVRWAVGDSSAFSRSSTIRRGEENDEEALKWTALEKLPTYDRLRTAILKNIGEQGAVIHEEVDVTKLGYAERQYIIEQILKGSEEEHEKFLLRLRDRINRVGISTPQIEVRFENLIVEAKVHVGSRALPSVPNAILGLLESVGSTLHLRASNKRVITILKNVSGIIKPGRMCLLLGPPSSGKTTLLLALAGKLDKDLKVSGRVTYNGHEMHEFVPQRTSAYISQHDQHLGELTVRETLDFSGRCQGVGTRYELLRELLKREKEAGIKPEADLDIFMKASSVEGAETSVVTDYILKILGLDVCADTLVGDDLRRGISGGQKKRVTTGEMLVGPARALFMDEISTGLDSSTTYQIVKSLRHTVHVMDGTMVVSLLQPPPETFDLFDDIIFISEGQIVYQGPREHVLVFFEQNGFKCPERKGVGDFLQEVTSKKDQEQYWASKHQPYRFVTVSQFAEAFQKFYVGQRLSDELDIPFDKSRSHPAALVHDRYALSNWEMFRACLAREKILLKRNRFVYIFKFFQIMFMGSVTGTVFFRTTLKPDVDHGNLYLGAIYFSLINVMLNGFSEMAMTMARLPVLYKHRDLLMYPAWGYTLPNYLLKIPLSFMEAGLWISLTYWTIGFAPEAVRFFRMYLVLVFINQMSLGLFRLIASVGRVMLLAQTLGSLALLLSVILGGFIVSRNAIHPWWIWGYWSSPLTYGQTSISINEFLAPRWREVSVLDANVTTGENVLLTRGFFIDAYWYWIGVGALFAYAILFNVLFTLCLRYLDPIGKPNSVMPEEEVADLDEQDEDLYARSASVRRRGPKGKSKRATLPRSLVTPVGGSNMQNMRPGGIDETDGPASRRPGLVLPFQPLSIAFQNVNYFVDMPPGMKEQGVLEDRLQLLTDVSGAFRPGVLTALMGVSGAGKTTLMDVLAGRKTGGYIEGSISISGYPKNQETFARISGYCEQNDIHSPNVTVFESLTFSAWMRLSKDVDSHTRAAFVEQVMDLVELHSLRNSIVGLPGVTGLSTEQRKRLTIAVELVANPSIIFMDEPTSGLDARAAAIVMRTVRNTVDTGRTVVCTIHQPSIDIFEAFDELLLMKRGGQLIYGGPLGRNSESLIKYFEAIPGVPKNKTGQNPATWMLEVSSISAEARLGVDFTEIHQSSSLYQHTAELIKELSTPAPDSSDLYFPTQFAQPFFVQCLACLWKIHKSYWRNPLYNVVRFMFTLFCAGVFGSVFFGVGKKRKNSQEVLNIMGSVYAAVLFMGVNNSSSVQPVVSVERTVFYRERAAGMYSPFPYAFAQVSVEWPYILFQAIVYSSIVFSLIQFEWVLSKYLWFLFFFYMTFLYFCYWGMMCISITPNAQIAAILSSAFYGLWNLFAGFSIARPQVPIWWRWYVWATPTSWTLYGLVISQLGDDSTMMENLSRIPHQTLPLNQYLAEHFGYHKSFLPYIAVEHVLLVALFGCVFAFCIKFFNFQRR
ncbi:unnamed protein product [Calypogeia fissa]